MHGHKRKRRRIPPLQHAPLKDDILQLASGKETPRITRLADSGFHERRKVSAALQLILYAHTAFGPESPRPLRVDLSLEVKRSPFIREVTRNEEEDEYNPEEESVNGEEGTVVKEDSRPPDERGEDSEAASQRGYDKFGAISNPDNIRMFPDVEPG